MSPSADDAAALDAAIAGLRPDEVASASMQAALRDAEAIARRLAAVPEVAALATIIARTLSACAGAEVEPHHAQWRLASAALTLRQQLDQVAAGAAISAISMRGAAYELEVLFPRAPDSPTPPSAEDLEPADPAGLVTLGRLTRRE